MRYLPTKYLLYTHYTHGERSDLAKWRESEQPPLDSLASIKHLRKHLPELASLLSTSGQEGILVLFFGPGRSFAELLDGVAAGKSLEMIVNRKSQIPEDTGPSDLRYAEYWREGVRKELKSKIPDLAERIRLVIPQNFYQILHRLHEHHRGRIRLHFVGPREILFYDTPKIVEAVVRIRCSGTGIPVLRIDHDVLFTGDNWKESDLGLYKPIDLSLKGYHARYSDHRTAAFMHSASYDQEAILRTNPPSVFSYATAFATRIPPALLVDEMLLNKKPPNPLPENCRSTWDWYASKAFDESLARRFYGLENAGLAIRRPKGLALIGAHPLISVISGALLCFSDLAIQMLPPFSNFGRNVSWIDDHLKYCLHRELRHFLIAELEADPTIGGARLKGAYVRKGRAPFSNLPSYTLEIYLPTLLYGTIMDAWINSDPLFKFRLDDLEEEEDQKCLRKLREVVLQNPEASPEAPLAAAMREAVRRGSLPAALENDLPDLLWETALKRIQEVRGQWSELREKGRVTFAAAWADGSAEQSMPFLKKELGNPSGKPNDGIGRGIAPGKDVDANLQPTDLEPHLILGVSALIRDAMSYISWTLEWPRIIQTVLSFPFGTFITDPPYED